MKNKNVLFFFIASLAAVAVMSFFSPFSEGTINHFQKKSVAAPYLNSGETGKILKKLNVLHPIENDTSYLGDSLNIVEVLDRATADRSKWLQLDEYAKYKEKGTFCYLEMDTDSPKIPFIVHSKVGNEWQKEQTLAVNNNRQLYPFFLDATGGSIPLQFTILNKTALLKIRCIVFIQNGYHPLVLADPISIRKFIDDISNDRFTINTNGLELQPDELPKQFKYDLKFKELWMVGISKLQKKQGRSTIELVDSSAHPLLKNVSLSDRQLSQLSNNTLPILAIEAEEDDLYSIDKGIIKNYTGHGKPWERISFVRFVRNGERVFEGFSGLRLQGGENARKNGFLNFRVFFRDEYGLSKVDSSLLFNGDAGDIKRLAIVKSYWEKWPANAPIAYEISRHIGILAPPTELIQLYLNGTNLGLYHIVPHLGEKQIPLMLPDEEYYYFRHRSAQHHINRHFFLTDFAMKLKDVDQMSERYARQYFDLDTLTLQLFSYLYNGTTDYCQGLVLRAKSPESKMFWYSWDMDHSFIDFNLEIRKGVSEREIWEQNPHLKEFLNQDSVDENFECPRVHLFRRLVNEDPGFREKVKHKFAEIMNHLTTDDYISTLLFDYWDKLDKAQHPHRDEYISNLNVYFQTRKPFIFKQIETEFPSAPARACAVSANKYPITVDGYIKNKPYEGKYFPGATLHVSSVENTPPKYWQVNNTFVETQDIALRISEDENCSIHAYF